MKWMYLQQSTESSIAPACYVLSWNFEKLSIGKDSRGGSAGSKQVHEVRFLLSILISSSSPFHLKTYPLHCRLKLDLFIAEHPQTRQFASCVSKSVISATKLPRVSAPALPKVPLPAIRALPLSLARYHYRGAQAQRAQPSLQRCHRQSTQLAVRPPEPRCRRSAQREVLRLAEAETRPATVNQGRKRSLVDFKHERQVRTPSGRK